MLRRFLVGSSPGVTLAAVAQPALSSWAANTQTAGYTVTLALVAQPATLQFIAGEPSAYAQILNNVVAMLQAAHIDTYITLRPEPYPMTSGPTAYVMPGSWSRLQGQVTGDGRYFAGVTSSLTVRVVSRSLKDQPFVNAAMLTDTSTGLLRTVHAVANILDTEFVMDDSGLIPLTEKPLVLSTQTAPRLYKKADSWSYVDLVFQADFALKILSTVPYMPVTQAAPLSTNLADLLLAVQSTINGPNGLNLPNAAISLFSEPYPTQGSPLLLIAPAGFNTDMPDQIGAGRFFDVKDGSFSITLVERNLMDRAFLDYQRLDSANPVYGVYSQLQALCEVLELSFPADSGGNYLAVDPLRLDSVDIPKYYGDANTLIGMKTLWKTSFWPNYSTP
jgi:hypothetical protein